MEYPLDLGEGLALGLEDDEEGEEGAEDAVDREEGEHGVHTDVLADSAVHLEEGRESK